jgi:ATP sulfurylase
MADTVKEVVSGLTVADVKEIADQVFRRTDGNHPQLNKPMNGFIDILQKGKPEISASPIFVRKITF